MSKTSWDTETIVREVMRRLAETPSAPAAPAPAAPLPGVSTSGATMPDSPRTELQITSRVVSLAAIEASLNGKRSRPGDDGFLPTRPAEPAVLGRRLADIRRVLVSAKAVITPAVRDLLRQRDITVAVENAAPAGRAAGLAVAAADTHYDPGTLIAALPGTAAIERVSAAGLVAVVNTLADRIRSGRWLGLLVTDQPVPAVCLANHQRGVRAAEAWAIECVSKLGCLIGANLLIVNPERTGADLLAQIADAFRQQDIRPCPDLLREGKGLE